MSNELRKCCETCADRTLPCPDDGCWGNDYKFWRAATTVRKDPAADRMQSAAVDVRNAADVISEAIRQQKLANDEFLSRLEDILFEDRKHRHENSI